jgi:hypothetical protein
VVDATPSRAGADAAHIAAFNPEAALRLLDALDAAEAEVARLRDRTDGYELGMRGFP